MRFVSIANQFLRTNICKFDSTAVFEFHLQTDRQLQHLVMTKHVKCQLII